jgi:hypothetical protein
LQDNAGNTCLKAPDRDEQKYARDQAKRHLQPDDEIMPRNKEMKVKWITLDPVEQTDPRQAAKPNTDARQRGTTLHWKKLLRTARTVRQPSFSRSSQNSGEEIRKRHGLYREEPR